MDKLINEGFSFTRMYATGTRSVRGIEAVTTGFSPTPARSVVKLGKSQNNFFSIAGLLKTQLYHTQFLYGGESHFDNMKSFFLGNGFVDMQDRPTFSNPKFVGSWGRRMKICSIKLMISSRKWHKKVNPSLVWYLPRLTIARLNTLMS